MLHEPCPGRTGSPEAGLKEDQRGAADRQLQHASKGLRCDVQAPGSAALSIMDTLGNASNVLGSPPVIIPEAPSPAAASPGHAEGGVGTGVNPVSPDQPEPAESPKAKEPNSQPAVNVELMRGQHQLEQVRT